MPRILTVDDSRPIRMIVSKAMAEFGFEIGEAEDGNDGLKKLAEKPYDLVILDVTMPNLDGPGMLAKMREQGDKTPVLMLTSESKTSIVATLMKMGIQDYVLKPFKADELRVKVLKALKLPPGYTAANPTGATAATEADDGKLTVMVIDDMENVHKKLRSMMPESVVLETCLTAQDALSIARSKKFRLLLVDAEIQAGGPAALVKQFRLLQPNAGIWGMALRSGNNVSKEMRDAGFDEALLKPFAQDAIDSLIEQYSVKNEAFLVVKDDLIQVTAFAGKEDKLERYFSKLSADVKGVVQKLGEACFEKMVLDATNLPLIQPARVAQFLVDTFKTAQELGISVRLVASDELPRAMRGFQETKDVHCFSSIEQARSQAA
jgi:two-component system, cell cycle response regulator